jgi:hypothetical protein
MSWVLALFLFLLAPVHTTGASAFNWPEEIYMGTSDIGTTHHVITSGWGALLETTTGSKVRITPEPDPARIERAITGNTDLIFMDMSDMALYYRGQGAYSDLAKENFYVVWLEYDPPMGYMVPGDSDIKTMHDIKARVEKKKRIKVAYFAPATAWGMRATQFLPAFLDISPEKVTPVPFGSINDMYYSILQGKADILCGGLSTSVLPALMATPRGIRFLDMPLEDKAAWQRALDVLPTEWPAQVNDWGVPEEFRGLGCWVAPSLYFATATEDEDTIYQLARWIHENYDKYKGTAVQATRMKLERFREFLDISAMPVHPGTVRYLREIGMWTTKDDEWNEDAKALMQQYVDAWKEAKAVAESKKIKIRMGKKKWETLWNDTVRDIPPMRSRY